MYRFGRRRHADPTPDPMSRFKPVRPGKKTKPSRARQIGCIVWLVAAMGLVMWLFYAGLNP